MERRHDIKEINLQITDLVPFNNEKRAGFIIHWFSKIGWGEYTIYKEHGSMQWKADSETLDRNNDKEFIEELMRLFIAELQIIS